MNTFLAFKNISHCFSPLETNSLSIIRVLLFRSFNDMQVWKVTKKSMLLCIRFWKMFLQVSGPFFDAFFFSLKIHFSWRTTLSNIYFIKVFRVIFWQLYGKIFDRLHNEATDAATPVPPPSSLIWKLHYSSFVYIKIPRKCRYYW